MKKIPYTRPKNHWTRTEAVHVAARQDFLFEGWTKEPPLSAAEKRKLQKTRQRQADEKRERIYYEWAYGLNSHGFELRDNTIPYQKPAFHAVATQTIKRSRRYRRPSKEYKGPGIIMISAFEEAKIYAYERWREDKSKPFEPMDILTYDRIRKPEFNL